MTAAALDLAFLLAHCQCEGGTFTTPRACYQDRLWRNLAAEGLAVMKEERGIRRDWQLTDRGRRLRRQIETRP
jgi:hypothetical protein